MLLMQWFLNILLGPDIQHLQHLQAEQAESEEARGTD